MIYMGTSELAWLVTRKMWEIAEGQAEEKKAFKAELVLGFFPPQLCHFLCLFAHL